MTLVIEGLKRIIHRKQIETHPEEFSREEQTILLLLWKMRKMREGLSESNLYIATWNWIGVAGYWDDSDSEEIVLGAIERLTEKGFVEKIESSDPRLPDYGRFVLSEKGKFVANQVKQYNLSTDKFDKVISVPA